MYIICRSRESETIIIIRPALYQPKSRKLLHKNLDFSWILHLQMRMPLGHEAEVRSWHGSIVARHAVAISAWPCVYSLLEGGTKNIPPNWCVLQSCWQEPSPGWQRWLTLGLADILPFLMGPYGFGTHHNRHCPTPFFWEPWPRMAEGHCRGRRRCQFVMVSTLMASAWKWSMERKHRPEGSWRRCTRGLGAEYCWIMANMWSYQKAQWNRANIGTIESGDCSMVTHCLLYSSSFQ